MRAQTSSATPAEKREEQTPIGTGSRRGQRPTAVGDALKLETAATNSQSETTS